MSVTGDLIVFFSQSRLFGGQDVVCLHLISHWDRGVQKIALHNGGQDGLERYIELADGRDDIIVREISFVDVPDVQRWLRKVNIPEAVTRWLTRVIRPTIIAWQALCFAREFRRHKIAAFFSNSGGYPGGLMNFSAILGAWLARVPQRIFVAHNFAARSPIVFRVYDYVLDRLMERAATDIVTVSRACAQQIASTRVQGRPIRVIYNGIPAETDNDYDVKKARSLLNVSTGNHVLAVLGYIEERKGHKVAIQAMPRVLQVEPRARLVFVGAEESKYGAHIRALSEQLDVEYAVNFVGFVPHADRVLTGVDVLLIPSVGWESFGLVALEAMARHKPVIVSDTGGLPEVVEHGRTGLVFPSADAQALADQIINVLNDRALSSRLSEAAFATLQARFTVDRMVNEYQTLLTERSSRT